MILGFCFCVTTCAFSVARSATTLHPTVLSFPVISILVGVFVTMRTMRPSCLPVVSAVFRKRKNPQVLRIAARWITAEMVNRQVKRYLTDVKFVHRSVCANQFVFSVYFTSVGLPVTVRG